MARQILTGGDGDSGQTGLTSRNIINANDGEVFDRFLIDFATFGDLDDEDVWTKAEDGIGSSFAIMTALGSAINAVGNYPFTLTEPGEVYQLVVTANFNAADNVFTETLQVVRDDDPANGEVFLRVGETFETMVDLGAGWQPFGGVGSLEDLSNVTITTPAVGQFIVIDSLNPTQWVNATEEGLGDVTSSATSVEANQLAFFSTTANTTDIANSLIKYVVNGSLLVFESPSNFSIGLHAGNSASVQFRIENGLGTVDLLRIDATAKSFLVAQDGSHMGADRTSSTQVPPPAEFPAVGSGWHSIGDAALPAQVYVENASDTATLAAEVNLRRERDLDGDPAVELNDALGQVRIWGHDGTNYLEVAQIGVTAAANAAANNLPGKMTVGLAGAGDSTPTARLTLDTVNGLMYDWTPVFLGPTLITKDFGDANYTIGGGDVFGPGTGNSTDSAISTWSGIDGDLLNNTELTLVLDVNTWTLTTAATRDIVIESNKDLFLQSANDMVLLNASGSNIVNSHIRTDRLLKLSSGFTYVYPLTGMLAGANNGITLDGIGNNPNQGAPFALRRARNSDQGPSTGDDVGTIGFEQLDEGPKLGTIDLTLSSNVVTVQTVSDHGMVNNQQAVVANITPGLFNGQYQITVTATDEFTYALVDSDQSATGQGTVATGRYIQSAFINGTATADAAQGSVAGNIEFGTNQGSAVSTARLILDEDGLIYTADVPTSFAGLQIPTADWVSANHGPGDVVGPAGGTSTGMVPVYSDTTGKVIDVSDLSVSTGTEVTLIVDEDQNNLARLFLGSDDIAIAPLVIETTSTQLKPIITSVSDASGQAEFSHVSLTTPPDLSEVTHTGSTVPAYNGTFTIVAITATTYQIAVAYAGATPGEEPTSAVIDMAAGGAFPSVELTAQFELDILTRTHITNDLHMQAPVDDVSIVFISQNGTQKASLTYDEGNAQVAFVSEEQMFFNATGVNTDILMQGARFQISTTLSQGIRFQTTTGTDTTEGAEYTADYSAAFLANDRAIPDALWVAGTNVNRIFTETQLISLSTVAAPGLNDPIVLGTGVYMILADITTTHPIQLVDDAVVSLTGVEGTGAGGGILSFNGLAEPFYNASALGAGFFKIEKLQTRLLVAGSDIFDITGGTVILDSAIMLSFTTGTSLGQISKLIVSFINTIWNNFDDGITIENCINGSMSGVSITPGAATDQIYFNFIGEFFFRMDMTRVATDTKASDTVFNIDPLVQGPIGTAGVIDSGDGAYFDTAGFSTGAVDTMSDGSPAPFTIVDVSDDGNGNAVFESIDSLMITGREVVHSSFGTHAAYNGIFILTEINNGVSYQVIDANGDVVQFLGSDAGDGQYRSVVMNTNAPHGLSAGTSVEISQTADYNKGYAIYNISGSSFEVNGEFFGNVTATFKTNSLDEMIPRVVVISAGTQKPSTIIADTFYSNSSGGNVVMGTAGVAVPILNAGSENWSIGTETERFTILPDIGEAIYQGAAPRTLAVIATASIGTTVNAVRRLGVVIETAPASNPTNFTEEPGSRATYSSSTQNRDFALTSLAAMVFEPGSRYRVAVVNEGGTEDVVVFTSKLLITGAL